MSSDSVKFPLLTNVSATLRRWAPALRALDTRARADDFSTWIDYDLGPVIAKPTLAFDTQVVTYAKYSVVGAGRVVFIKLKFSINITVSSDSTFYVALPIETQFGIEQAIQVTIRGASSLVRHVTASVGVNGISATDLVDGERYITIHDDVTALLGDTVFLVDGCYLTS